jgi:hypothetical protein
MKNTEEKDHEIIHRILDGDAGPAERQELLRRISDDTVLREEFDAMERPLRMVESGGRKQAPPFFTAEVMKKLPASTPGVAARISEFLFANRVLRWNMAGALAGVALAILVIALAALNTDRPAITTERREGVVVVTMNLYAPEANRVSVAGSFNKWKIDADVLTRAENGYWTISIPLKPGDYSYMFVVDGKAWVTDPNAEAYRDDGFGSQNAVLRVKT